MLGIEAAGAEEFACSMEHTIHDHILQRLVCFAEYTEKCPRFKASWRESAKAYFCAVQGCDSLHCEKCNLPASQ